MRMLLLLSTLVTSAALTASQGVSDQTPTGSRLAFEVTSIKPNPSGETRFSFGPQPGGRWSMVNGNIQALIREAYPTPALEPIGAPAWTMTDRYDINTKATGSPTAEDFKEMIRSLLSDRFKFRAHFEMKETQVLTLRRLRPDGSIPAGLTALSVDCEAVRSARRAGQPITAPPPANGAPLCGYTSDGETWRYGGVTLARFSESLGIVDGRIVLDRTGLNGVYEFSLRYTKELNPATDIPSLHTALQDRLGLKLVREVESLRHLVIDHIERPSPD
jgi:uncharacterized protein (TIGR03435 family)